MSNPSRLKKQLQTIMTAKATTGIGNVIEVSDFRHIQLVISSSSSANGTLKIAGTFHELGEFDFATSASATNEWDYVGSYNLNNPTTIITGDTGIVYAGTDAVEQVIVNVEGLKYLTVNVTARSAGSFNVKLVAFSNL
jgi:hypothetical protein